MNHHNETTSNTRDYDKFCSWPSKLSSLLSLTDAVLSSADVLDIDTIRIQSTEVMDFDPSSDRFRVEWLESLMRVEQ